MSYPFQGIQNNIWEHMHLDTNQKHLGIHASCHKFKTKNKSINCALENIMDQNETH